VVIDTNSLLDSSSADSYVLACLALNSVNLAWLAQAVESRDAAKINFILKVSREVNYVLNLAEDFEIESSLRNPKLRRKYQNFTVIVVVNLTSK